MDMLRTQRRRKASDGGEGDTLSIDRLSDLPDSILCHILSFLPTKTSVRTSILAKRWRFVWKYVPNLYFYRENQDFINRVFFLHELPSINTLRLDLGECRCSGNQMETWIVDAVGRNVQNLDISHNFVKKPLAPLELFTCETLVDLRLDYCCIIPLANTVCLPRLKKLNLSHVQFEGDESLPRLLWGCPVLEYLQVTLLIENPELVIFNISSPTLKRLEVDLDDNHDDDFLGHRLKIDTPALEYLLLKDCVSEHIESGMMTSLTEADIILRYYICEEDDLVVYSHSVLEFVNSLCNVKRLGLDLDLSTEVYEIIDSVATVSFHNLTELQLHADGLFLSNFLEITDNLEILIFEEACDEEERAWVEPKQVPTCLSSHLRTIKMFRVDTSSDFEILRYLLRNGRILERIEISYCGDLESKNWWIKQISKIKRGSEACKLAFV